MSEKLTERQAMIGLSDSFERLALGLENRSENCSNLADAGLHRQSAAAIRSLLTAYRQAIASVPK